MAKLITLDRLKTFLSELNAIFQKKLTFDSTPTEGSTNPVTSGGVYDAINNGITISVEPSDGSSTWLEVPTEDLYVGGTEPTDDNVIWIEIKES